MRIYRYEKNERPKGGTDYTPKWITIQTFNYSEYCPCYKRGTDKENGEYIEISEWTDRMVKTENVIEVTATFPVTMKYKSEESGKVITMYLAMSYTQMYNLLHRDCSRAPYDPYGRVITTLKKKEDDVFDERLL